MTSGPKPTLVASLLFSATAIEEAKVFLVILSVAGQHIKQDGSHGVWEDEDTESFKDAERCAVTRNKGIVVSWADQGLGDVLLS